MAFMKRGKQTSGPKQKKGFLDIVGVKTEKVATEEDKRGQEMDQNIMLAWKYLRSRIDLAVHEYYRTGKFTKVEQYVERPALDALKQELHTLRAADIYWQQPDRQSTTEPHVTVVSKELNKRGQPTKFVIQERFRDFSVHQRVVDGSLVPDARADGDEHVIQATVTVRNGAEYRLHSVIKVRGAAL